MDYFNKILPYLILLLVLTIYFYFHITTNIAYCAEAIDSTRCIHGSSYIQKYLPEKYDPNCPAGYSCPVETSDLYPAAMINRQEIMQCLANGLGYLQKAIELGANIQESLLEEATDRLTEVQDDVIEIQGTLDLQIDPPSEAPDIDTGE